QRKSYGIFWITVASLRVPTGAGCRALSVTSRLSRTFHRCRRRIATAAMMPKGTRMNMRSACQSRARRQEGTDRVGQPRPARASGRVPFDFFFAEPETQRRFDAGRRGHVEFFFGVGEPLLGFTQEPDVSAGLCPARKRVVFGVSLWSQSNSSSILS